MIRFVFASCIVAAAMAFVAPSSLAQGAPGSALAGRVSSGEEGPMEGVLVSATKDGSTVTVTVASDAQGHYSFPAARLEPGHYRLAIRAVGYDLAGPGDVAVKPGAAAIADLTLVKTHRLTQQLTDAEWMTSAPGTDQQRQFLSNCVGCHTVQRIFQSTHDAAEFQQIFIRMSGYSPGSVPTHPQPTVGGPQRPLGAPARLQPYADWLASINLSKSDSWNYPLKTLPRPKGRGTRMIVTEYNLPRPDAQPHDVVVDGEGMVWYADFGHQFIGELDPGTGKVTDYPLPLVKPGFPTGALDLELDPQGNLWVSMMYQTGVAKFDRKEKKFTIFPLPQEWQANHTQESMVTPAHADVDGKVWSNNQDIHATYRLDLKTGRWENLGERKDPMGHGINAYGIPSDLHNNLYMLNFGDDDIGRLDAKTLALTLYKTPTPHSRPRRGRVDTEDNLWFAEYGGNAIARFDPKTERITEWKLPTPFSDPYDVVRAKSGDVWTGSMLTDRVDRLNPATGEFVEYLLPRETNIRRIFVDGKGALWVGSNHGASIVKLEALD